MKRNTQPVLSVFLGVCLATAFAVLADLQKQPPNLTEIAGAWVGYEDGGLFFYRIALETNGVGSCVVLFNDESLDSHSIDTWRMVNGKLTLQLTPKNKTAEPVALDVSYIDALRMELTVSGATNNWTRKAVLYNEREFLRRASRTTNAPKTSELNSVPHKR